MGKPSPEDQRLLDSVIDEAARCVEILFKDGMVKATNRLNAFKA